jgi:hypothetical protein
MRLSLEERRTRSLIQRSMQEIRGYLAGFLRGGECCGRKSFASEGRIEISELQGQDGGIPHLAKNQRDVAHPSSVTGKDPFIVVGKDFPSLLRGRISTSV